MKRMWNSFIDFLNFNKKTIIINFLIFLFVFTCLILIDQLTKLFLFKWNGNEGINQTGIDYQMKNSFFGIRSVFNYGLTATFLNNVPLWAIHLFNFAVLFVCAWFLIALKSKFFSVFIGFIVAGTIGNMIDRFLFLGVRDILFIPWLDKGTFNFADLFVIVGVGGSLITLIVLMFVNKRGVWIEK